MFSTILDIENLAFIGAMHEAREDFVKNDANEKLRRALLHQVRVSGVKDLVNGDSVFRA